jgi:hypothetical protein
MGIRYYAYAFNADQTEQALADPRSILSDDPLADAWGLEPGAQVSFATFEQSVPVTEMLYLDKAWSELQAAFAPTTSGASPRPAFRMFEGGVTMHDFSWDPWIRVLTPAEVQLIAEDLAESSNGAGPTDRAPDAPVPDKTPVAPSDYAAVYLERARAFVTNLAAEERGKVYMIG